MKHRVIIDCRDIFSDVKSKDIIYLGLGKPQKGITM